MDLVDRNWRGAVVRPSGGGEPLPVLPWEMAGCRDDRGGAWRNLRFRRVGVGLQRQHHTIRADNFIFVDLTRPDARHKDLPEPPSMAPAHRQAASVPRIEPPDDADPLSVRRPYREGHALDAVM